MNAKLSISYLLNSLDQIHSSTSESYKFEKAFKIILKSSKKLVGADTALLGIVNEDRQTVEIVAEIGLKEIIEPIPLKKGIIGWTAFSRKTLLVKDFKKESKFLPIKKDSNSCICLPMLLNSKVAGVFHLESNSSEKFNFESLKVAKILANESTKALSKIWLVEQLKSKTDQLHSLINLNRNLVAKLDRASILTNLATEARGLLNCHSSALFLFSHTKTVLDLHTMVGPNGIQDDTSQINLGESAIGTAVRRKKQIEIHNILFTEENAFNKIILREKLYSMLITPIIYQNAVIGVLNTYTQEMHRFSDDEKSIALALADLGAITLENARLYEKTFNSEEILRRNEKLTTLGLLSAEIAHEIRNPLTVIKLLFQTLDLKFATTDPRTEDVNLITEKINHLETIVERVLGFSHRNHNTKATYCLSSLTKESLQLVRLKLNQLKISIDFENSEKELNIDVNKGQIQQVILNLIFNSSQAMTKSGGLIKIKLYKDDSFAHFSIKDNGHGIPKELQDRIFESFLTNKSEGSGLGLSIAQQILSSHRGKIVLLESSSTGSTFQFSIPLSKSKCDLL